MGLFTRRFSSSIKYQVPVSVVRYLFYYRIQDGTTYRILTVLFGIYTIDRSTKKVNPHSMIIKPYTS